MGHPPTSKLYEGCGYSIGMGLAEELANCRHRLAEQIPEKLFGIDTARPRKDQMILILDGIVGILI